MDVNTIKRVGILRGGMGDGYVSSLRSGGDITSHIQENLGDKYKTFDILIDKDGVWHLNGLPISPDDLQHKIDLAWNVSGPSFANILSSLSIPHVSVGAFAYALQNSEELLREHMKKVGVEMPRSIVLPLYQKDFDLPSPRLRQGEAAQKREYAERKAKEIHQKFGGPWIVKSFGVIDMGPVRGREGSQRPSASNGMGVHLAKTFQQLVDAIEDGVKHEKSILVEEFISGKVASLHSVANFRNEEIYTFPLHNTFGNFTQTEKEKLINIAKNLHRHIGAGHYLKSDFILSTRGKSGKARPNDGSVGRVYILGIEGMPNTTPQSHFSEVCELVGVKPHHIVEHILESVIQL